MSGPEGEFLFFQVFQWYPLGPDGGLHYHYDGDGVHLSNSGMRQYHDTLQTEFFNFQCYLVGPFQDHLSIREKTL